MTKNDILTLAQRLREYRRNPHHIDPVSDAFNRLITDSADALSQLAAIQGEMGDEPLVVATAILGGLFHGGSGPELGDIDIEVCTPHLEKIQCETVDSSDDVFMPLMTVAQHQRITAAMAAEVERLQFDVATLIDSKNGLVEECNGLHDENAELRHERDALRAELERVRDDEKTMRDALNRLEKPEVVFINMKRGMIAKPSLRSIIELYAGEVLNGEDALQAEILRLRAELAEVKGREAVATIEQREPYEDGTPNPGKALRWAGNNAEDDFPAGTKLYALVPAPVKP